MLLQIIVNQKIMFYHILSTSTQLYEFYNQKRFTIGGDIA